MSEAELLRTGPGGRGSGRMVREMLAEELEEIDGLVRKMMQ